ncbi:MAG: lysophospholipid acyltransferase family protein [Anaerolineae bacterium]|nr:lysophospholipid acyltransferase family protein [Anaerolineae bacterium]
MRDLIIYSAYRLLAALVGPLPPRIGYWMARRAGPLIYRFSPHLRRVLTSNMSHVLGLDGGDTRVRAAVDRACVNIARGHYELFRVSRLTLAQIRNMTQIEGLDRVYTALEQGKGAVIVTAHFGNVDMMGQVPLAYGIPISGAVEHIRPERLFRYLLDIRQKHGLRLYPSDGPMVGLFKALRRGELVALPCDRAIGDYVRPVEFFGEPAWLPDGPVRVALRTGAPLIPVFIVRQPDNTFRAIVEPPLDLVHTGDVDRDVAAGMERVVEIVERYLSTYPEQWLVAVPVWPLDGDDLERARSDGERIKEHVID